MKSHTDKSGQRLESVVKIKRKPLSSFVSVFDCEGVGSEVSINGLTWRGKNFVVKERCLTTLSLPPNDITGKTGNRGGEERKCALGIRQGLHPMDLQRAENIQV